MLFIVWTQTKFVITVIFIYSVHCKRFTSPYLLTPWSRVLLEKLTIKISASQEIPRIYGTRKFLTVPTSTLNPSLSLANSIQSPLPRPTS